jgi:hypothetical protein
MLVNCGVQKSNKSTAFSKVTGILRSAMVRTAEDEVTDSHTPSIGTDHQTTEFVKEISPFRDERQQILNSRKKTY